MPRSAGDAAIRAHLSGADPVLAALLERHDVLLVEEDDTEREHYAALVRSIVGQQLSTHVARIMWERMLERYGGRPPTPEEVLAEDPEELRSAIGLSRAKVSFLRSLAEHVTSGELDLEPSLHLPLLRPDGPHLLSCVALDHDWMILAAKIPAFSAPSTATQATGTPGGIWATESNASSPSMTPPESGTPITGSSVWEAAAPGSAADMPAPAMITFNPRIWAFMQ